MTLRTVLWSDLKVFLLLGACLLGWTAHAAIPEEVNEKRVAVAMRMIGHEILLSLDDCTSRILPIDKTEGVYKIPFETEFEFEPSTIAGIVERVMAENNIHHDYLVEVRQCSTGETVHSFIIRQALEGDLMPCQGRALPLDCYSLYITFLDDTNDGSSTTGSFLTPGEPSEPTDNNSLMYGILLAVLTSLGAGAWVYKSRNEDSDKVNIGSTTFDEKNMVLIYGGEATSLSHKEAELLTLLHSSNGEPIEREVLLQKVWGDEGDYIGRTLDVFISKLRKKLEPDASLKIVNIRSVGYKLVIGGSV